MTGTCWKHVKNVPNNMKNREILNMLPKNMNLLAVSLKNAGN